MMAKILQLTVTLLLRLSFVTMEVFTDNYSSESVANVEQADLISWASRGVTDCALKCKSMSDSCNAFAFQTATTTCVASAVWNANFSAAAPDVEVFRKPFYRSLFPECVSLSTAPVSFKGYNAYIGQCFTVILVGNATGSVWGSGNYTGDSTLGKAAVHAGLVKVGESASVRVLLLPGQSSYLSSDQNGIVTTAFSSFSLSYKFLV